MDAPDIIVSGHLCVDLLPDMDHVSPEALLTPGKLTEVGGLGLSTGGAVSNVGLAAHRLGAKVNLMSGVGDDLLGQVILEYLNQRDPALTQGIKVRKGQKSSYTLVLSPLRMDRVFLHCTGTNASFNADDIDYTALEEGKIFHLGYPPILPRLYLDNGEELERIFRRAKEKGIVTSLDMSLPDPLSAAGAVDWKGIIRRVIPYIDVFVPSIEEALFMLRRETFEQERKWHEYITTDYLQDLANELLGMGRSAVVGFKLGEYGVFLKSGGDQNLQGLTRLGVVGIKANESIYHPTFAVNVVGTTGAGDSAYAALLVALTRGIDLEGCSRWMNAVGACNVEAADSNSSIRTWEDTAQRIASGWSLSSLHL